MTNESTANAGWHLMRPNWMMMKGQKKKVSDKQQACPSLSAVHVGLLASSSPGSLMERTRARRWRLPGIKERTPFVANFSGRDVHCQVESYV